MGKFKIVTKLQTFSKLFYNMKHPIQSSSKELDWNLIRTGGNSYINWCFSTQIKLTIENYKKLKTLFLTYSLV